MREGEGGGPPGPPIMRHATPVSRMAMAALTLPALISSGIAVAISYRTLCLKGRGERREGRKGREGGTRTNSRGERAPRGHLIAVRGERAGGRATLPLSGRPRPCLYIQRTAAPLALARDSIVVRSMRFRRRRKGPSPSEHGRRDEM